MSVMNIQQCGPNKQPFLVSGGSRVPTSVHGVSSVCVEKGQVARCFIEELIDYFTDALCREDLKSLITKDGVWKAFVEAAELSSQEQAALHDALEKHLAQEPTEENERPEKQLQEKSFLEEFPELKRELEEHIRKLRDLAGFIDKLHEDCTTVNVVSGSVGVASALGLALAPVTAGVSLLISATSLGIAAGVTSVATTAVEESITGICETQAKCLVQTSKNIVEEMKKLISKLTIKFMNTGVDLVSAWKTVGQQICAIRMARASSCYGTQAREFKSFAEIFAEVSKHASNALFGSALLTAREAKIMAVGLGSIFLPLGVYNLVTDSMDLYDGAKTESAGALRDLAHELEKKMKLFEDIHKAVQSDLPQ
ncbi:hypothetical protein A6R68_23668 [Neotoma lepida]|uniref:Apolipoprotein L3 n=1 Tax=Neotoma lepida TaxID=56216 RepID=A0A1A6HV63_NEOLE|nr:hypothetical protein A6R68_23668 [Neotoma lepida]